MTDLPTEQATADRTRRIFARLTGSDPADLQRDEAASGLIHATALSLTKVADSLLDPKLALAWLLSALEAPGFIIGALVPVP